MVVFELGNFVYNTSDDEMTIFLTFLRQMLVLSYSLRPAMMIGVHVASKRSIELCSSHNLRSIPQNAIDEVNNSNSLNDLYDELIS